MKKILYIDMDGVLVDFESGLARVPDDVRDEHKGHEEDIPGVFSLMDPVPDALDAFRELARLFDTYILSTPPWDNPAAWTDKALWVQAYLGDTAEKRLILTHHKDLNRGDYLIDDRTRHGADLFQGEHIHFGSDRFPDWDSVLKYLRGRA